MKKPHCAFQFTVNRFFEAFGKAYLWTLTWSSCMPDFRYAILFNQFMKELQNRHGGLINGIRVVEVHPGGHGLHYHLIVNLRIGVRLLRAIGKKYGIGRVHVTPCNQGGAYYIGKYLSKPSELTKGARRWGTIGGFRPSRVRDIEIDSLFHRNMEKVFGGRKVTVQETTWVWSQTAKYGPVGKWPDPTHRYTGNPVWVKCCCPTCALNRKLVGSSGTYLLQRGVRRKQAPFSVKPKLPVLPPRKTALDHLVESYEALDKIGASGYYNGSGRPS